MALQKKRVSVFGVGIDTKADPKLMPAGELIELENMWQKRTGELAQRNGFTTLSAFGGAGNPATNLYASPGGVLSTIQVTPSGGVPYVPLKYVTGGGAVTAGWKSAQPNGLNASMSLPVMLASVAGIEAAPTTPGTTINLVNPDMAIANGTELVSWADQSNTVSRYQVRVLGGQSIDTSQAFGRIATRPVVCAAGGALYLVQFVVDNGAPGTIQFVTYNADGSFNATGTFAANLVSAAQPWLDAKPIPGTNTIAVAYRATAGGVTCGIFTPATGAFATTVTTAAMDASMCLGWLDDSFATGNMYLATAGAGAGVVVRTMSATTMAVSAFNIIDNTATANVRQITGHLNTGATDYIVLWDVDASPTYFMTVKRGAWSSGAAAVIELAPTFGLYSRTFKHANGRYYFIGSYDSVTQATYSLIDASSAQPTAARLFNVLGQIMPGYAGGRRSVVCSLSTVTTVGGVSYVALARKQRLSTSGGVVYSTTGISRAAITLSATLMRPRELGGTVFYPGGIICRDDGKWISWALSPVFPEVATLVSSATGSMTASGAYSYRWVWRKTDAQGRVTRSAGSVVASITLGAGDGRVTHTIPTPRQNQDTLPFDIAAEYDIEIYRAGPAAAGATGYNKVGEASSLLLGAGTTVTFIDTMSDANAALGEAAYFTGNVLENFPTPSCNLMEVCGSRLWIVNAEYPTELWFSKEYKPGTGIGFFPDNTVRIEGDGRGPVTALAAMDGRLIAFKDATCYAITGNGPNDLGQGTFNPPQAISTAIGTSLPGSVVAMPDGIMFQSAKGIYLLDRGLGLTYIGSPVEQYTLAANVVDASLVDGYTQVRFVMANGRCLVWDYFQKRWYTWLLKVGGSTVVACANSSTLGWCYLTADGVVRQEVSGATSDDGTSIIPRIGFPHLSLAGLNGYQRFYGMDIQGEFVGNHTLSAQFEYDGSGVLSTPQTKAITAGTYQYEVNPGPVGGTSGQRCSRVKPTLTLTGASIAGGFKITGIGVTVGVKKGNNIPYTSRLT